MCCVCPWRSSNFRRDQACAGKWWSWEPHTCREREEGHCQQQHGVGGEGHWLEVGSQRAQWWFETRRNDWGRWPRRCDRTILTQWSRGCAQETCVRRRQGVVVAVTPCAMTCECRCAKRGFKWPYRAVVVMNITAMSSDHYFRFLCEDGVRERHCTRSRQHDRTRARQRQHKSKHMPHDSQQTSTLASCSRQDSKYASALSVFGFAHFSERQLFWSLGFGLWESRGGGWRWESIRVVELHTFVHCLLGNVLRSPPRVAVSFLQSQRRCESNASAEENYGHRFPWAMVFVGTEKWCARTVNPQTSWFPSETLPQRKRGRTRNRALLLSGASRVCNAWVCWNEKFAASRVQIQYISRKRFEKLSGSQGSECTRHAVVLSTRLWQTPGKADARDSTKHCSYSFWAQAAWWRERLSGRLVCLPVTIWNRTAIVQRIQVFFWAWWSCGTCLYHERNACHCDGQTGWRNLGVRQWLVAVLPILGGFCQGIMRRPRLWHQFIGVNDFDFESGAIGSSRLSGLWFRVTHTVGVEAATQ